MYKTYIAFRFYMIKFQILFSKNAANLYYRSTVSFPQKKKQRHCLSKQAGRKRSGKVFLLSGQRWGDQNVPATTYNNVSWNHPPPKNSHHQDYHP